LATFIPLPGAETDEIRLELGHHGEHIEQEAAHGIGRVVNGSAQTELDLAPGEVVEDLPGVRQGASHAVQLGDHQGVAGPAGGQRLPKARTIAVGAGQAVVDVDPFRAHAESSKALTLSCEVLGVGRDAGVADQQRCHGVLLSGMGPRMIIGQLAAVRIEDP
jgi:hypothetical protein